MSVRSFSRTIIRYATFSTVILVAVFSVFGQDPNLQYSKLGTLNHAGMKQKTELEKWQEDLHFLAREMPKRHKNLFHTISQKEFEATVDELKEKLPKLTRNQAIMEFGKIVAKIGDGHTTLWTVFDREAKFNRLPIVLYVFKDGVFVQSTSPEYKNLLGARILKIGDTPIEKVIEKIKPYISIGKNNEFRLKTWVPNYLISPEVLQALKITNDIEKTPFEIEKDGKTFTTELILDKDIDRSKISWIHARNSSSNPTPIWLKKDERFWFEYLKQNRLLYVQLNNILDKKNKTLRQFFEEVVVFAKSNDVEKFVLDIRSNGGGSSGLNVAIIRGLIQLEKIDKRGKLFVIIGRRTFSAAQNLVNELEKYTNAVFVGEPTGAGPNHYGDARPFKLPNSKLTVRVSTLWWQDVDPRDTRKWKAPDVAAEATFADYANNIDTPFKAILEYNPQKSLDDLLTETEQTKDFKSLKTTLIAYKNDPVNKYLNIEGRLNRFGYMKIFYRKVDLAIEFFKLNTELFPNSSNAYDSLAEGYLINGDKQLAINFYEKSLELNPKNRNAARQLKKLKINKK
ncbi:MAG: hypothetical protein HKN25_13040 [Pyrinomonadaceae bacterium]|nr:hypothetical protein [Pyrinomonadaceae bacterium]